MLTWRNARVVLLLAVVVAVAAGWFLSQREATPVTDQQGPAEPECVGEECLDIPEWPEFTIIYTGRAALANRDGIYGTEIRMLEWRGRRDWKLTVLSSDSAEDVNAAGSWDQQSGTTHSGYFVPWDESWSETDDSDVTPDGFSPFWLAYYDIDPTADGVRVPVDIDVCTGSACHDRSAPTSSGMGKTYPNTQLSSTTFSDDHYGIPLESTHDWGLTLELQIWPTQPAADLCETYLRGLHAVERLESQQWGDACNAANRSGSRAHAYVFELREERYVTIRAASNTDDIEVLLYAGTDKTAALVEKNDGLVPDEAPGFSHAKVAGIERELAAGTYTVEVVSETFGGRSGTFVFQIEPRVSPQVANLPEPIINVEMQPGDP